MTPRKRKVNRSATDRLKRLIEAELNRQDLTDEEAAREGKLPGNAFRALRKGHRPGRRALQNTRHLDDHRDRGSDYRRQARERSQRELTPTSPDASNPVLMAKLDH